MFANVLLGVCAGSCLYTAIGIASLLRFLPSLLGLLRYLVRLVLVCSYRLYRLVLTFLAPYGKRYVQIDILSGWARLAANVILSLVLTIVPLLLLRVGISVWTVGLAVGHGLIVGLLWDDLSQPDELQLGIKLS